MAAKRRFRGEEDVWPAAGIAPGGRTRFDRRSLERYVLRSPLPARLKGRLAVRLLDISARGALAEVFTPLRPGTQCEVAIRFADAPFAALANVRRLVECGLGTDEEGRVAARFHVGLEFEPVSRRALDLLEHELVSLRI